MAGWPGKDDPARLASSRQNWPSPSKKSLSNELARGRRRSRLAIPYRGCRPQVILPPATSPSSILQREGDVGIARLRPHLAAAAGDHDILFAVHFISARRRVSACRELRLPEQLARALVEGAELFVF